jgi:AcrR family transcriptional regulator
MIQQTRREKLREATLEEIKALARKQMATEGAMGISLRGIAAELGMTSPALYRYYASRDDLLTALVVDAYNSLADAIIAAAELVPTDRYGEKMLTLLLAYWQWSLEHLAEFGLIFGSPVPGYQAPAEITVPAARRSLVPFLEVLGAAAQANKIQLQAQYANLPDPLESELGQKLRQYNIPLPPPIIAAFMAVWGQMHGLVTLEVFGHLHFLANDPSKLYRHHMQTLVGQLGLEL